MCTPSTTHTHTHTHTHTSSPLPASPRLPPPPGPGPDQLALLWDKGELEELLADLRDSAGVQVGAVRACQRVLCVWGG